MRRLRVARVDTTAKRGPKVGAKGYFTSEIVNVTPLGNDPFASMWRRTRGPVKRFVDVELSCGHVMRVTEYRLREMQQNVSGTVRCEWCQAGEDNQ